MTGSWRRKIHAGLRACRGHRYLWPGEAVRAAVLFLFILVVYMATMRVHLVGDTIPARLLPLSIIREFDFDLDEFSSLFKASIPYYLEYRNGHLVSAYPVGAALLALPFYLIPVLLDDSSQPPWLPFLEKLSATAIAVLSALFLYLAVRRLTSERTSMIVTAIYALGTSTFSISSQALWQHGPSQFFLTLGLYLLIRGLKREAFIPWSGFALSAAVVCRQTDVLLVLPIFIYLVRYHRGQLLKWTLFALPPAVFFLGYHYFYFGSIFEMGHYRGVLSPASPYWTTPFFYGLLGLLISPSKGLFVYSPILLLAFVGMYAVWTEKRAPLLRYLSFGPVLVLLLHSKWHFWWGGGNYGPRLLADITPFMSLYLYPVWGAVEKHKVLKGLFVVLAVTSLIMHAIGAFTYDESWYTKSDVNVHDDRLWSWRDTPFGHYGKKLFSKNLSFVRTWISPLPTSAQMPQELSASLALPEVPDSLLASRPLTLTIGVTNTGGAIWLFQTSHGPGAVSLGWRWLKDSQPVASGEGRALLSRDVFPGEQEEFRLKIWPPSHAGHYTLELGMVGAPVTWFATRQIPVEITETCDFEAVMEKTLRLLPDPPGISVRTDKPSYRPDEVSRFSASIANGQLPYNLMVYVVLERPDGSLLFLITSIDTPPNSPCSRWTYFGQFITLSKRFWFEPHGTLLLKDLSPGLYTLYAFLTEPNTTEVVAKATSTFRLLPHASAGVERKAF